jgi:four helix bundle protein
VRSEFRDLVAYTRAEALAGEMYELVREWNSFDRWSLGLQLVRSSDSIGANIAEACGRWHQADQRRLLIIARGSLYETEHWIAQAERRGLLPVGSNDRLQGIAQALSGLINRRTPS